MNGAHMNSPNYSEQLEEMLAAARAGTLTQRYAQQFGAFRMADGDDDDPNGDGASGDGSDGGSGTEGQGTGTTGSTEGEGASGGQTDDEKEQLRKRMQAADKRAADAEKRLKDIEDSKKDELTRTTERVQELETTLESQNDTIRELRLNNAFLSANDYAWHDPEDALRLADLSGVEIDPETGRVSGLKEALKKLADKKPHLVAQRDGGGDGGAAGSSGANVGGGKRKGESDQLDREALAKKYPALRRG